jgi:hypothetical protein
MTLCRLLARGKLNACLVEFEDGYCVATSRNYLVKLETWQKRTNTANNKLQFRCKCGRRLPMAKTNL